MKLLRFVADNQRPAAGLLTQAGVVPVAEINARTGTRLPDDLLAIIQSGAV
ncbi:MAG: hypothetical protein HYS04_20985, partial [Acidobacteria bacterium]|nr:hypothetical protein [Acidobacteriota bacterium]